MLFKMKILFSFLIFGFNFFSTLNAEKIICNSTKNIEIKENEIVYFESPNFPKSMDTVAKESCKIEINGNSTKVKFIFCLWVNF